MTVHLIAACGHRGQIGRAGDLPWRGNPDLEVAMAADLGTLLCLGLVPGSNGVSGDGVMPTSASMSRARSMRDARS